MPFIKKVLIKTWTSYFKTKLKRVDSDNKNYEQKMFYWFDSKKLTSIVDFVIFMSKKILTLTFKNRDRLDYRKMSHGFW